jgi:hypothetical protein
MKSLIAASDRSVPLVINCGSSEPAGVRSMQLGEGMRRGERGDHDYFVDCRRVDKISTASS